MIRVSTVIIDHVVLGFLAATIAALAVFFPMVPLPWTILFFGLPIAYMTVRKPKTALPAILSGILFGGVFAVSFEYLAEINNAWVFPQAHNFYLPWHVLGVVPADVMVWYFLWAFIIVQYYEFFFDVPTKRIISHRAIGVTLLGLSIAVALSLSQVKIHIPYVYAVLGTLTLLPVGVLRTVSSYRMKKLLYVIPFFTAFFLLMELSALKVGYWSFTGQYVYSVGLFGFLIPIEEIIFWIVGSPAIIVAYHELFIDDEQ